MLFLSLTGRLRLVILGIVLFLIPAPSRAHTSSDSYLRLHVGTTETSGQWAISLRDLQITVGLDGNQDGTVTWGELQARQPAVQRYAFDRLRLVGDGQDLIARPGKLLVDENSHGMFALLNFTIDSAPKKIAVHYRFLFDLDPQHRGLMNLETSEGVFTAVFTPAEPTAVFAFGDHRFWSQFGEMLRHGVWHIWIGIDHILFLIALLLPAVLQYRNGGWEETPAFRPVLMRVIKIVTAFTLAHSLTLSLAALRLVNFDSRWVESLIAASVIVAALNNVRPFAAERGWWLAFVFGLIHGFGFANVLTDLGLEQGSLAVRLVAFNLGVELGQLAIVMVFLPVAFALRQSWFYQRLTLRVGSLAISMIAALWVVERILGVKLIS